MYRYIKILEMPCPLRKLFFFPLVTWHLSADGIISFLMGLASPRDVFGKGKLPGSITVFWGVKVCLGVFFLSALVALHCLNTSLQAQAVLRVPSVLESMSCAAPFSPRSKAVFWIRSPKPPQWDKVSPDKDLQPTFHHLLWHCCQGQSPSQHCLPHFSPPTLENSHLCNQCCGFSIIDMTLSKQRGLYPTSLLGP